MTNLEKLKTAEKAWLDSSQDEDFFFGLFQHPKHLRRSHKHPGALADLVFGKYQGLDQQWISDERAIWLGMIVSDQAGSGGRLLNALSTFFARLDLFVIGTPTPLKPRDWDPSRPFSFKTEKLICWYMRHGFRVVQSGSDTRVIHPPLSSSFTASFMLK